MRINTSTTIIREVIGEDEDIEVEIEIEATYYPGRRATYLDPEEFPEVDIISATIDGEEVELTEAEIERAEEKTLSDPPDRPLHDY